MGGMQVMQWMTDFPDIPERVLILASTARQSTQAIAFNEVGRSAIHQDPTGIKVTTMQKMDQTRV